MIKERSFINKIMKQEIVFYIIILIVYIGKQGGQLNNLRYIHINSGSSIFSYNRKNNLGHFETKMKYYITN